MAYTQENRFMEIETPLGKDALLLAAIQGNEGISTPFSFELNLLSANNSIKFKDIIGKNVTVSIELADGEKRYFNGLISRFAQGPSEDGGDIRLASYSATMVPWLWLLSRTADSRIFQNLSVPEIAEKVFKDSGFLDFKLDLGGSYDKRDYCVQYRETDLNFVSRLLEEEGIFYFFEHEKKKHTLVIADAPDKHKYYPKQESAWCELATGGTKEKDLIEFIEVTQEITAGKYTLNDFNFEAPKADLKVDAPSQKSLGPGEREVYDYPGGFGKRAGGDRLVNIRMEEDEAEIINISGSGRCRAFTSGYKFTLKDYDRDDMNDKDYVLTYISHSASQGYSLGSGGSKFAYSNSFTCIPFEVPYRPPRAAPRPVVEGVQTAMVVGPSGEEIYTDKYGRVKVQFHWDREGKSDEKSSCWVRVSQNRAGRGWGESYVPHVGQEVIVSFLEGDPDHPIVTGRVYNADNMPPVELPAGKTQLAMRDQGGNEIIMEGKGGGQQIKLHSPHSGTTVTVGAPRNPPAGFSVATAAHQTYETGGDVVWKTDGDVHTNTRGNYSSFLAGNWSKVTQGNSKSVTHGSSDSELYGTSTSTNYAATDATFIGAKTSKSLAVTNDLFVGAKISNALAITLDSFVGVKVIAGKSKEIKHVPSQAEIVATNSDHKCATYSLDAISDMVLTAGAKIELKCGGSSITITPGKITIDSPDIIVTGKKFDVTASSNFQVHSGGSKFKVDGGQIHGSASKIEWV